MGALQEFERELERGPIEAPLSSRQSRRGSSNFRALMSAEIRLPRIAAMRLEKGLQWGRALIHRACRSPRANIPKGDARLDRTQRGGGRKGHS